MGIKNLNRFLKENCSKKSIRKIQLQQVDSHIIVVDTSIYMYRYIAENALMENMYMLISLLLSNNIVPLFVFDGKPPPEKRELLRQRRLEKKTAQYKYTDLMTEYNSMIDTLSPLEKQNMLQTLSELKQQFVRVTDTDIQQVKDLLTAYGVMYYESMNEADEVCAYMVKSGKAWACLSDDMDMFVYGCTRVLRNLSLLNKSVILYDTQCILEELCMTENTFKQIMVLSGTDYNTNTDVNLDTTIQLYTTYTEELASSKISHTISFYKWLHENSNYIANMDNLLHVCELFDIKHIQDPGLANIQIVLGNRDNKRLLDIMSKSGFVFT